MSKQPGPALHSASAEDLGALMQAYGEVTEQLKRSHELLAREVCRLREQLDEKNRALARRERLAALGEMAAGVAHEIRNPLGGISLYASLLDRDLDDRPDQRDIARRIGREVRHVEQVVTDILAFAGGADVVLEPVALQDVVDDSVEKVRPRAAGKDVRFEVVRVSRALTVSAEPAQLGRAVVNLLANAVDAVGERGSVSVRVSEGPARVGDPPAPGGAGAYVTLFVEDDGPGIPDGQLDRIFNPFFTTKETGTGLGLAIVHRTVEAQGGWVRAENRDDGGARFVVTLQRANERADDTCAKEVA